MTNFVGEKLFDISKNYGFCTNPRCFTLLSQILIVFTEKKSVAVNEFLKYLVLNLINCKNYL